ncbi:MAG: sulfatase-like hydrolase/transferase [Rhodospirillaceae bacterium]|nr:sulfatase-like hydrolase/transferase [Rhodospirillaceae bacterium]
MRPTNLLIIMSDEHNPKVLGCNGHPLIKTPHMDALAARGTRFTAAYTNSPICIPARASFATGRHVHEMDDYWDNGHPYDGRVEGWGHALQRQGHAVTSIGKLHYRNADLPTGFDEQIVPMHVVEGIGDISGCVREPLHVRNKCRALSEQIGPGNSTYLDYDRDITRHTLDWLENEAPNHTDKPWVLFVSFVCPHFPLIAPPEFYEMYPLDQISQPKGGDGSGYVRHPWAEALRGCQIYDDFFSEETRRIAIASYYGMTSFLDDNIGQVLAKLDAVGLADDTRVIYTSDHGDNLGARGLWGKSNQYEESAGVPMIMAGPDIPVGQIRTTPVSHVDCHQSVFHSTGAEMAADDRTGRSLFDIVGEPDDAERIVLSQYHAVGAVTGAFMLRQGSWKYVHYVGLPPELFDLANDPEEMTDLGQNPAQADRIAAFERALRGMLDPEAVDASAKASQRALVEKHGGREAILKKGGFGATPAPGEEPVFESSEEAAT